MPSGRIGARTAREVWKEHEGGCSPVIVFNPQAFVEVWGSRGFRSVGMSPRDLEPLANGLTSEGLPARLEDSYPVFSDPALRDAVQAWYTKLILYNRHIHRAARI